MLLRLVGRGLGNKAIAEQMHYSVSRIKDRVAAMYRRWQVHSRVELVAMAYRAGVLKAEDDLFTVDE